MKPIKCIIFPIYSALLTTFGWNFIQEKKKKIYCIIYLYFFNLCGENCALCRGVSEFLFVLSTFIICFGWNVVKRSAHDAYFQIWVTCGTRDLCVMLLSICEVLNIGTGRAVLLLWAYVELHLCGYPEACTILKVRNALVMAVYCVTENITNILHSVCCGCWWCSQCL
jgi:hypothetical protein